MDNLGLKQKISRFVFFLDEFRYRKGKHLYFILFILVFLASAATLGIYFHQKNEVSKKENILRSYFEIASSGEEASDFAIDSAEAGGNHNEGSSSPGYVDDLREDTEILQSQQKIKVYICGCVTNPGVYEVENQSRIADLAEVCGGFTDEACIEAVNLARKLNDADRIYIPSKTEVSKQGINLIDGSFAGNVSSGTTGINGDTSVKTININTSTAEELTALPGIGEQIAENIINYRDQYGLFKFKEDLKNVKGIGEKKYEQIKDLVSI
jgi:competence protein ComEA